MGNIKALLYVYLSVDYYWDLLNAKKSSRKAQRKREFERQMVSFEKSTTLTPNFNITLLHTLVFISYRKKVLLESKIKPLALKKLKLQDTSFRFDGFSRNFLGGNM